MKKTYLLKASVMLMVVLYYICNTSCGTANLTNKNNYYQNQYKWCVENNHPYKDIIYAFLHPETVTE